MNHTPTPWMIGQYQRELDEYGEEVLVTGIYSTAEGVKVAKMEVWTGEEYRRESDANAEFVVRACNAHEELVKSLKEMTTILSAIQNTLTGYLTPDSTLDQDDCINAVLDISDHEETLYKQRSALQLLAAITKGV